MKRIFTAVLCCLLMLGLCACSETDTAPATPTPSPTPIPEPTPTPEPETEPAEVLTIEAPAVLCYLSRGDVVELAGEVEGLEKYCTVKFGDKYGLVEKRFLRFDGDEEYEVWTGYAQKEALLYSSYLMNDESPVEVERFTEVNVVDEFDDFYFVEFDGKTGVMPHSNVSRSKYGSWGGGGDGGGGGGGGGADGGDISLGCYCGARGEYVSLGAVVEQKISAVSGKATVRLDKTPMLLALLDRGETVRVLERGEKYSRIYIIGLEAETETRFLRFGDGKKYESWTGYAKSGAERFDNPWLLGEGERANMNTEFTVLEDFGNCCLVEKEGELSYVAADMLGTEKVYGGWGGGGDGGGSGGEIYTEPAM